MAQTPRPSPGPVIFPEQSVSPASPPAGYSTVYVDNTGAIKKKNSSGTITSVGTVTSVGLNLPAIFSVSDSPITTSGSITATLASQTGSTFLAAPEGADGTPSFRIITTTDLPELNASQTTSGTFDPARLGSGTANSSTYLRGDSTWATIPGGGLALQTQTSFTNNSTPVIYLKAPSPNTTPFLQFLDNSDASKLKVYSDGSVESAGDFYSGTGIFATTSTSITLRTAGNIDVGIFREYGSLSFEGAQPSTSGVPKAWLDFTGTQNNTGITASTEYNAFWYNPPRTYTWAAGSITNQRFWYMRAPTAAFASASTITTAATFAISGAPIAGTNATITNPYALWIGSGTSQFDGNVSLGSSNVLLLGGATSPGTATRLQLGTPTTANNNVNVYLEPTGTGITALAIQGNSSQSADLFQAFDSSGNKTFAIAANGIPASAKGGIGANTAYGLLALSTLSTGNGSTAFGYSALTSLNGGGANTAFGYQSGSGLSSGTNNVSIGYNSLQNDTTISSSVVIGSGALSQSSAGYTGTGPVLAIGRDAGSDLTSQNNIAVFGSVGSPLNDWYFGESYSTSSPSNITFQPSVGSGTNIAGSSFYIRGGAGTGNATPGKLYLQYASDGSSGTTVQSYTTAVTIDSTATDVTGVLSADKIKGGSSAPSVAAGAGAGTSPTIALTSGSSDSAGELVLTTGTSPTADTTIATITFSSAYSTAPFVVFSPSNLNAAVGPNVGWFIYAETSTTAITFKISGVLDAALQYKIMYTVVQ